MKPLPLCLRRLAAAALSIAPGIEAAATEPQPPHVVLFLVDDLGWSDTSVVFAEGDRSPWPGKFPTPAVERLAETGMRFSQFYACSVCSPTRVSLMTGLNAARHRVTNWTLHRDGSNDRPHPRLDFPDWNVNGLSPVPGVPRSVHRRALPSWMKAAGYATIHVGKAHFGAIGTPGADPLRLGFDRNVAGHAAGGPGSYYGQDDYSARKRRRPPPVETAVWDIPHLDDYHGQDVFLSEALTREAIRHAGQALDDGRRLFLYLSHYAVHAPIVPDRRFVPEEVEDPGPEESYVSLVRGVDRSLADVLTFLAERGIQDETVVLFLSDNGGLSAHARGGEAHTHNLPLRSGKGSAHEGGVRVPLIVRWPGVVEAGSRCDDPVIVEDLFPTLLELAGIPLDGLDIDGASIGPALRGGRHSPSRPLLWHYPNHWGPQGPGIGPSSSLRVGDHKLIYYHDPARQPRFELFDLSRDRGETTNLVASEAERGRELAALLERQLIAHGAQMPTVRSTAEVVSGPLQAWDAAQSGR